MSETVDRLKAFVEYAQPLGDEKGEAQVFCDRLFKAFGHEGYTVCGRVTKRPIFAFVESSIRPNDALQVFAYEDDYSFAYFSLQSTGSGL